MGIFPKDDSFQEFSTNYGQKLASYMRHRPWVTAGDTASTFSIGNCIADLHNGYSTAFNIASFQSQFDSGANDPMGAVLWRQAYITEARVGLIFRFISVLGAPTTDDFRWVGVCARVTGGSYTDTTGQQSIRDTSGYWFLLCHSSVGSEFVLLRVNGGVTTRLQHKNATSEIADILSGGHVLQMEVTEEAGNVRINTLYDGAEALSSVLDSSGSKLTAAGRCGFGMCRDRQPNTPTRGNATLASRFTIFDMNAGATLLADDFTRVNTQANPTVQDENGLFGKVLMSMWALDVHGYAGFAGGSGQYRDAGFDRIDSRGGVFNFSQIAATDPITQARSVVFRRTANVAYLTGTGIVLRGTMSNTADISNGYLFTIHFTGAIYSAIIRRFNAGVSTLIATADVTTDYGIVNGTDFRLLASVENNGTIPQLLITVNDIAVAGWTLWTAGVTQLGALVFDGSANAIQTGPAQAINVIPYNSTADGFLFYKLWTDEVPPDVTDETEENEPSFVIGAETDGKTGVHSMPIGSEFEVEDRAREVDQRFETQHVARVNFDDRTRRLWRIQVGGASQAERQDLWDFWDEHGKSIPFDFVDPESPTGALIPAHFFDDSLVTARTSPATSSFGYVVEELFSNDTIIAFVPGTRLLRITGYAPSVNVFFPPSTALSLRTHAPNILIGFAPASRALTITGHPPIAP